MECARGLPWPDTALDLKIASTTQPAMVVLAAGLKGLQVVINKFRLEPLVISVLFRYHLSARTGQLRRLDPAEWPSLGREIGAAMKLLRSFLAKKDGLKYKVAPFLENTKWSLIAKACISDDLRPDASARRKAVLTVKSLSVAERADSKGSWLRASNTILRSQLGHTLRGGGGDGARAWRGCGADLGDGAA